MTFSRNNYTSAFLFVTLFFLSTLAYALDPSQRIQDYKHAVFKHKEGLPQHSVTGIAQTPDGYLWVATHGGLARFDGIRFVIFDKNSTPGITHNSLTTVKTTSDGTLWIGSVDGLMFYRNNTFTPLLLQSGLSHPHITTLLEDGTGVLWVGTKGGGITRIKNFQVLDTISTKSGILSNIINAISQGPDGTVYIATPGGVSFVRHNKWHKLTREDGLNDEVVRSVFADNDTTLWIGTDNGLYHRTHNTLVHFTTRHGLPSNAIRCFFKDRDGNLWIGTTNGICRFYRGVFTPFTKKDGLSGSNVSAFYEDHEGSLWIGTIQGGVDQFFSAKVRILGIRDGLLHEEVRPIYESRDGSIWVGTNGGGLTRFKPDGSIHTYTTKDGLAFNGIRALCEDANGALWIGTSGGGVSRLYKNSFTTWTKQNGLSDNYIYGLTVSRDNTVWIGTREGGLITIRHDSIRIFTTANGLPSNTIRTIIEADDGTMWICTDNGISHFINGTFQNFTKSDGLSYDVVYSVYEDNERTLWIGTYGGGLNRLKNGTITAITKKEGLYDNGVFQIIEDHFGNLWMTSNRGIFYVPKYQLNEIAEGKRPFVTSISYGETDGMKTTKCNGSAQPAGILTRKGELWIPTLEGVAILEPAKALDTLPPPHVTIDEIFVKNQKVKLNSELTLTADENNLEIRYTALSFLAPEQIRFSYMLAGFDTEWKFAENKRYAVYSNLPSGTYQFQVKACNRNGVWGKEVATIAITIEPHIYETLWFRALLLVVLAAGIYAFVQIKTATARRQEEKMRELVKIQTQHLREEIEERKLAEAELRKSRALYQDLVETAQDVIWRCDKEGRFTYLNVAATLVFGEKVEEILGKTIFDYFPPEEVEHAKKNFNIILASDNPHEYETIIRRADGRNAYVILKAKRLYNEEGTIIGVGGTFYDITERKYVEERLRESEERYRNVVQSMPVAILILRDERIIFANTKALQIFKVQSEVEIWGKKILPLIDPSSQLIFLECVLGNKREICRQPLELTCRTLDGRKLIIELNWLPMEIMGAKVLQLVLQDITERKLMEEELLMSQKLQSLGTLAGGIAHDFNNILGIIIGYASRFDEKWNDREKQKEYIKRILAAAERGAGLVRQILTYARKTTVATKEIQIYEIVDELFSLFKQTFPKIITLVNNVSPQTPPIVGDPTQLHQAILNLCVNARDAMPNGGTLTVSATKLSATVMKEKFSGADNVPYLCISVTDTGVGMSEEIQKKMFDPFFTTKEVGKGTGLGLSVVYGIVQSHNGFIDVESASGKGSTIRLYFPLRNTDEKE